MRLHILQHVAFEGPGHIAEWAHKHEHALSSTHLYQGETLPAHDQYDRLVIMGGPMNIHEHNEYPWLEQEKTFIKGAVDQEKTVLGICLGAQLLADILGAEVSPGQEKEIGFFPIKLNETGKNIPLFAGFPECFEVLHWHGDTFSIPDQALHFASSEACQNQAFLFNNRVLGLQFHFESTEASLQALLNNCEHELVPASYVQNRQQIEMLAMRNFNQLHSLLESILDRLP